MARARSVLSEETIVSPWSQPSAEVKVDRSAPNAPNATPDRAPDYAGGSGWDKDSVTVSFTENGDPLLPDGSAGSGVNPASIPAAQTLDTSGSHTACGTGRGQRRQRIGTGLCDGAGRCHTAGAPS
jgi:hypothetical protein